MFIKVLRGVHYVDASKISGVFLHKSEAGYYYIRAQVDDTFITLAWIDPDELRSHWKKDEEKKIHLVLEKITEKLVRDINRSKDPESPMRKTSIYPMVKVFAAVLKAKDCEDFLAAAIVGDPVEEEV